MKNLVLQISPQQNKAVEIINAIGNTWPFVLTVAAILFVVFNRKNIAGFLARFNKLSGKTPIGEITVEESLQVMTKVEGESQQNLELSKENKHDEEGLSKKKTPGFYDIYMALKEMKINEAETLFQNIQNKEQDSIEKEKNIILYLEIKYYNGIDTISQVKEKINAASNNEVKRIAHKALGDIYYNGKNLQDAIESYRIAYSLAKFDEDKTESAKGIANCLYDSGEKGEAFLYLNNINKEIIEHKSKGKLFRSIASLYEKEDNWILRSIALEMALVYNANDADLLFNAAYSYSNDHKDTDGIMVSLALLHYNEHIQYKQSPGVFNNLGVAFHNFGIIGKGIENYRKAIELGNTLAAANMADKYIKVGFYSEAKEILNKAKNNEDVHENVWSSLNDIAKSEKDENDRTKAILEKARQEQLFVRKFGEIYFGQQQLLGNVTGSWKYMSEIVEIVKSPNNLYYVLSWNNDGNIFSIPFEVNSNISQIGSGSYSPQSGGLTTNLIVFVIFSNDCKKLDLLLYDKRYFKSFFYEFIKV